MHSCTMLQSQTFTLTCYGNGLAYSLTHWPSQSDVFVQGDAATALEKELDAVEAAFPDKTYAECVAYLWDQCGYSAAAEPLSVD